MRYLMKEHLISLGDDYTISDENGNARFRVRGRVFTIGDKLSFQDMDGRELAFIRQRLIALRRTYDIERDGRVTTVSKSLFTLMRCRFTVDVPGPDDLEATGSLLDHEYRFVDAAGAMIAEVSKRWVSIRDTYSVDIAPGHDDILILAAAVVIDQCCHEGRN